MCSPLPLRLCCMAAMAPALTEAGTQAHIRLSSSPTVSPSNSLPNNRECRDFTHSRSNRPQGSGLKGDVSLSAKSFISLSSTHPNGGLSLKSHFTQLGQKTKVNLANFSVISALPDLCDESKFMKFTKANGNCHQDNCFKTMNKKESIDKKASSIHCKDSQLQNEKQFLESENSSPTCSVSELRNGHNGIELNSSLSNLKQLKNTRDRERLNGVNVESPPKSEDSLNDRSHEIKDALVPPVSSTRSSVEDTKKTQTQLERRAEYLKRRLRRLQNRLMQTHARQQMINYVSYQNNQLKVLSNTPNEQSVPCESAKSDIWQAEDVKNLSTVALVSLVKKIQTSQNLGLKPPTCVLKPEVTNVLHQEKEICEQSEKTACEIQSYVQHVEGAFDSDATESSSGGESGDEHLALLEKEKRNRLAFTPLHRRPEWKWAVDRAGIAWRWTWLQAQVSDLEYRIRQQSDIYRQIRANKGTVVLGETPVPEDLMLKSRINARPGKRLSPIEAKIASIEKKNEMSPCNISSLICNVDKQTSKLALSLGNCLSPSPVNSLSNNSKLKGLTQPKYINGFNENRTSASEGSDIDSPDSNIHRTTDVLRLKDSADVNMSPPVDASCQAARCRPVKSYRKRKLLRTTAVNASRKATRLSSVKCQCYPPITACVMCGGRYNATRKVNLSMHTQEKISLLDSSIHPILSFPQDTPLPIHLEATITADEWQAKMSPKSKAIDRRRNKLSQLSDPSRKAKRYARGVGILSSTKYRRKFDSISRPSCRNRSSSLPSSPRKGRVDGKKCRVGAKRRRAAKLTIAMKRSLRSQSFSVASSRASSGSRTPTPSPQGKNGFMSATFRDMKEASLKKKRVESAYDIDNIVIPYSMAASTRVTKLNYAEIDTPKWRDIMDPNTKEAIDEISNSPDVPEHQPTETGDGPNPEPGKLEIEDCTDEAFLLRHAKCEGQEKKRFTSFVQYGRRVRGSRTESGSNTPDLISTDGFQPIDNPLHNTSVLQTEAILSELSTKGDSKMFLPIRESKDGILARRSSLSGRDRSGSLEDSTNQVGMVEFDRVAADPWPLRSFPLEEEDMEKMLAEQPSVEELKKRVVEETAKTLMAAPITTGVVSVSRSSSPTPSTSTSFSEEDPNDPEWTVHCNSQQTQTGLV